ncbi:phenylacetic acid degradation protein PaaN [Comamonas thiooxydans]|uniref:phenylacetic acid degradation protein PaaN n=1 Tax=Comamonas thiooxydans TaxID=363952 RepID=UPI00209BBDEA|nr:phenylacetic acid degradation protein PaaN [Comamonas thiooxydans]MCO8251177.1 phenylacetic acid degradation protein PaaN [Comamonas thiooxydans]
MDKNYFETHRERLERAWQACQERGFWSPFPEVADAYPDSARAQADGRSAFEACLGKRFDIDQPGIHAWVGDEVSPYTRKKLDVKYPQSDLDSLFAAAETAMNQGWAEADPELRVGLLMEVIERQFGQLFELVNAVFHTTGQSYNMSYAGSGVNALDRGIEALAYAWSAMNVVPRNANWARNFGSTRIELEKTYRLVPRGVSVCFTCASFPTWNALPSMMASLATGNAVIVKAHPATVLPMAMVIRVFREVLQEAGFDPNLVTLALDSREAPIGKEIVKHPSAAIIDFTGSVAFGKWVEDNAHPALAYTETAGCNTVVLESCEDFDGMIRSLATTMCMFSAQMCTSPQNIYVPRSGIRVGTGDAVRQVSFDEVAHALVAAVDSLAGNAKRASMILATIQAEETLESLKSLKTKAHVLRDSQPYVHPECPNARTATPLILRVDTSQGELYRQERFGPVSFVIAVDDSCDALNQATSDVKHHGGLTAFLYSLDEDYIARAERAYARAGAQLTINLTGPMPLNFAAAYSDYHVTGLNSAGNAALTDHAFVASRFRIVQSRRPVQK